MTNYLAYFVLIDLLCMLGLLIWSGLIPTRRIPNWLVVIFFLYNTLVLVLSLNAMLGNTP